MRFEWDPRKNQTNHRKHGVWFEEAQTAFYDDAAIVYDDPDSVIGETRFVLLGMSSVLRVLVVVHCLRDQDAAIRIISARKATHREIGAYQAGVP